MVGMTMSGGQVAEAVRLGEVALPAVVRHWRRIALAVPEGRIDWLNSMVFRGMKSMPLDVSR